MPPVSVLAPVLAVPFAAIFLGAIVAATIGRPAQFWRISLPLLLVFASILAAYFRWPPRLGVELTGGAVFVYEVSFPDEKRAGGNRFPVIDFTSALHRRIDPAGTRNLLILATRHDQFEIRARPDEIDVAAEIQQVVNHAGDLQFRIVADKTRHVRLCQLAEESDDFEEKTVKDETGRVLGRWVRAEEVQDDGTSGRFTAEQLADFVTRKGDDSALEILTVEDKLRVNGDHIASVNTGYDANVNPCVNFQMTREGAVLFGALTGSNLPDVSTGTPAKLGIILDGELLSAPNVLSRITDRGQITGRFTQEEVDFVVAVLKAGRLPGDLNPVPIRVARFAGDEQMRWARWCLAGTTIVLLLAGILAVLLQGVRGIATAAAILSSATMFASSVVLLWLTLTLPTLAASCAAVLVFAVALLAFSVPRKGKRLTDEPPHSGISPLVFCRIFIVLIVLGLVIGGSVYAYPMGPGDIQRIAIILILASLSGATGIVTCLLPLLGLFPVAAKSDDSESQIVRADLAE